MKKKGCCCAHKSQRDKELLDAYKNAIAKTDSIVLDEIWHSLAKVPCSRFWISEERAAIVISHMLKGDKLDYMRPLKKEMFRELLKRVKRLKRKHPKYSLFDLCVLAVNSRAPKFYMTELSIRQTVYKIRQKANTK